MQKTINKNSATSYTSWGRYPKVRHSRVLHFPWYHAVLNSGFIGEHSHCLAYGKGRSYGDSCLNEGGVLIDCSRLNHIHLFDKDKGILRCEAGVSLDDILSVIVPHGWFLPVTPGTRYVTVAGALANDVHGKNHHRVGSFGNHVIAFELKRSNNEILTCSRNENADYFKATIGGLGLTGLITWVEFSLKKIVNSYISTEQKSFASIEQFFDIENIDEKEYTVAWIDTSSKGSKLGRGIYFAGEHAKEHPVSYTSSREKNSNRSLNMPINLPNATLNSYTIKAFNNLYFFSHQNKTEQSLSHYAPFFYPLDNISNWNRMYGKRGFFQYQCVVPIKDGKDVIGELLRLVSERGMASFLSVLKRFGNIPSIGMMSFPREGYTLALDFPNKGKRTLQFLNELDKLVQSVNGAIYPAKDARMSASMFNQSFPLVEDFKQYIDPQFSSSFWRRVTEGQDAQEKSYL